MEDLFDRFIKDGHQLVNAKQLEAEELLSWVKEVELAFLVGIGPASNENLYLQRLKTVDIDADHVLVVIALINAVQNTHPQKIYRKPVAKGQLRQEIIAQAQELFNRNLVVAAIRLLSMVLEDLLQDLGREYSFSSIPLSDALVTSLYRSEKIDWQQYKAIESVLEAVNTVKLDKTVCNEDILLVFKMVDELAKRATIQEME
jgi:hypothetical protein